MTDPNLQWDGTRWLRWNGQQWVDAGGPSQAPPTKSSTPLIIGIVAVGGVVLLLAGVITAFVVTKKDDQSEATSTPSPTSSFVPPTTAAPTSTPTTPASPTATVAPVDTIFTMYFVNVKSNSTVYAAGVKTRGTAASGWAGVLRSGDITCFNGIVANGMLTGTLVSPPDGGGAPVSQPFSWRITGSGEQFRLVEIGDITPLREVPPATVNDYAGLKPNDSWQPLFTTCAQLTGGLS